MFDHNSRKQLTLAAYDEERKTKLFQSQVGGVNKMYGIFRSLRPRTTHATVATNKFTQIIYTAIDSLFKYFHLYFNFILSRVSSFVVIFQVKEALLALSEFKTKRTGSFVGETPNMTQTTRLRPQ
jgi:hypothetical protein